MTTTRRTPGSGRKRTTTPHTPRTTRRASATAASRSRTTRRTSATSRTTRRRRAGTASTIGAGVGTLVVTALLGASWAVRIALVAVVLVAGLGYLLWTHRSELS